MALAAGTRVGSHEIGAQIGQGGMGEVYRALDNNLGRQVAIKILPDAFAQDPERVARFEREAKTLASLNHPNIAQIYGLEKTSGVHALVMELVEGPTIADCVAHGPIPLDEALPVARQIVDALEAAHEHGIIHRDLKPANVKVRPDGTVKVLDFGLAKASDGSAHDSSSSMSPTLTSPLGTQLGVILGTAAYMAPEQARGRTIDKRADIWAFGCVLFEMLTGARAFDGEDVTDVLASIVKTEPNWKLLREDVPANVRFLLERCLEKDRRKRLRDIGDFRLLLDAPLAAPGTSPPPQVRKRRWPIAVATAGVAAAAAVAAVWMLRPDTSGPVRRFTITLDASDVFSGATRHVVALSPNGRYLVYVANQRLYLRPLAQLEATPIRGTEGSLQDHAREPFFSPDSQWIGFWHAGSLKKVSVTGGAPVTLTKAAVPSGATWGANDTILFGQGDRGIWQVPGTGGQASALVAFDEKESLVAHGPQMLPGQRGVLFTQKKAGLSPWDEAAIVVQDLSTAERRVVLEGGTDARYVETGHLVYVRDNVLLAVGFDIRRLEINGGPVPLVEGVMAGGPPVGGVGGSQNILSVRASGQFALSATGSLAYIPDPRIAGSIPRMLVWVDRSSGKEEPVAGAPVRSYTYPRISPDPAGSRVALDVRDQEQDIWTWDFGRQILMRITRHAATDLAPLWTPDGSRIVFSSGRTGASDIYWQAADGTGDAELLQGARTVLGPNSMSPDGTRVVYHQEDGKGSRDLFMFRVNGDRKPEPIVTTPSNELNGVVSPDGHWIAMESNESGRLEVWLRPFPDAGAGRHQVSTTGGTRPVWARSGRELFYMVDPPSLGDNVVTMMAVSIQTSPSLALGTPVKLFEGRYFSQLIGRTYDVSPDGKRFLMIKDASSEDAASDRRIIVVENWQEELKQRVSTR